MTELELKARAYDLVAQMQFCQNELAKINAELAERAAHRQPETDGEN